MMTAERWYEYQNSYKRYGIDMKPQEARPVKQASGTVITTNEKIKAITMVLFAGLLCICLIVITAYTAGVKYEINSINKGNAELMCEIQNLNVDIKNATNLRTIEAKAEEELGMIYPSPEQFVFLSASEKPQGDFAALLKEQAYD
ncbi:MAG: hypothetical protein FWG53_06840 [Clostridiales bacterium]|nr:hypothetical protein [Clostridiales bacterium]